MIVTTMWEVLDIKAGVKVVEKKYNGLNGTIVRMRGESSDNVVSASTYALVGSDHEMLTHFMTASKLAQLLTEHGCTL